jgi:hypothetical protein
MVFANDPDRASYQKVLRSRMRDALMRGGHRGCWGRLLFSEVCHTATTFDSNDKAVLARLISFRNGHYVFIAHGSVRPGSAPFSMPAMTNSRSPGSVKGQIVRVLF